MHTHTHYIYIHFFFFFFFFSFFFRVSSRIFQVGESSKSLEWGGGGGGGLDEALICDL